MYPPYKITKKSISLIADISILLGKLEGLISIVPSPQLRKQNKIRTIHGTLAIEGNTLSIEQITAIIDNKKILGPKKDILEVNNALKAYEGLDKYNPNSLDSLCKAHKIFMNGLVADAGKTRSTNVGILKGNKVSHVAPQPKMLPRLLDNLFTYLKKKSEHSLIKSSVFHYEFEFIHPFSDGNGRLGRFWQTLILYDYNPIFQYIPIESLIKENQRDYYLALENSDKQGESGKFIEFMLRIIYKSLSRHYSEFKPEPEDTEHRINKAREHFKNKKFTRKDYIFLFKNISTATASRDLKHCVASNLVEKIGDKRTTVYKFIKIFRKL